MFRETASESRLIFAVYAYWNILRPRLSTLAFRLIVAYWFLAVYDLTLALGTPHTLMHVAIPESISKFHDPKYNMCRLALKSWRWKQLTLK